MSFDLDSSNTDEYLVTAVQIFDCCGVHSSGALRVDALMDKFAPFVKTNKADFSYLSALMDPEGCNPEINVTKLASALHKYSQSQKSKMDLDESFNLKGGQVPQDSDSGISSDGLQILEELQSELKEKEHLAAQLRSQLDYCDRAHEDALAALTAERDTLKKHLLMCREENSSLNELRHDYDEACERLAAAETELSLAKSELDSLRRKNTCALERITTLEGDKMTLQELLSQSKHECHHMNDMYAARQSALLGENETLKAEHAELSARFHDHEEFLQQTVKEKILLEMELKDVLNKSNQTQLRLDRSIDVSYCDDNMLTTLDTINSDTRFDTDNRLLDEDSFNIALKEDHGRATNISLFDEIRLSFYNTMNVNTTDRQLLDNSMSSNSIATVWTQTDEGFNDVAPSANSDKADSCVDSKREAIRFDSVSVETQTEEIEPCAEIDTVENVIERIGVGIQIDACNCQVRNQVEKVSSGTQTIGVILEDHSRRKKLLKSPKVMRRPTATQTDYVDVMNLNNNDTHKCLECAKVNKNTEKLETDVKQSKQILSEIQTDIEMYEENLVFLKKLIDEGNVKNKSLLSVVENLNDKIGVLERECETQNEMLKNSLTPDTLSVGCQKEFEQSSVSTQADVACVQCEKRTTVASHRTLRRFFWEALKCLFQVFAVVCFVCAAGVLCGVAGRGGGCRAAPWRWLTVHDVMDLLLRVEYTAEVPM